MAAETLVPKPRTLFVGISTPEFVLAVRDSAETYFNVVDSVPPTGVSGGLPLRGPGVIPHDAVVVAFSPNDNSRHSSAETIDAVVNAFPESEYYFVFPDDQPEDSMEPFVDSVLAERIPDRAVVSLRNFISALEFRFSGVSGSSSRFGVAEALGDIRGVVNDQITVTFDPSLSAEQIEAALTALADYYRACGGVGLPADDFESQEALVHEDALV